MDNVTATELAELPWFLIKEPKPEDYAVLSLSLFGAAVVLGERAGVTPEQIDAMVQAGAEAMAKMPVGTSPEAELDGVLIAARDALQHASV